jgi:hypothetical protein
MPEREKTAVPTYEVVDYDSKDDPKAWIALNDGRCPQQIKGHIRALSCTSVRIGTLEQGSRYSHFMHSSGRGCCDRAVLLLDQVRELPAADCFDAGSLDMGRLVDALTKRVRSERARQRVRAAGMGTV